MKGEPVGVSQNQSNKDEEEERGLEELTNHAPLIRVNSIMVEYYYYSKFIIVLFLDGISSIRQLDPKD